MKKAPSKKSAPEASRAITLGARKMPVKHAVAVVHADLTIEPPAEGLGALTLPELEAADRGLRNLPEQLEKMSGIASVLNGMVLTEIKGRLQHKEWTPWLKKTYGKSASSATRRMQIAAAFSKSCTRARFEPQQLTLALLDGSTLQQVDTNHPVVMAVTKWTDGRSYRQLIADETGDGRSGNTGGFRPNAQQLKAWLKAEYPDSPEYLETDVFTKLPADVQKRFKAEGERYWGRLTKEEKDEIAREEEAIDFLERAPGLLAAGMDRGLEDFATPEQLKALIDLLGDYRAQVNRKLTDRAAALPKGPARKTLTTATK